mgnify:CR=1 FL=1
MTSEPRPYDLAVIGGGPAGLATILAARALAPAWRLLWCRGPDSDFLPAYGGNSLVHRLNVPVERMGLDAEAPVDFFEWLRSEHPERDVQPGQFVPRRWFGEYMAIRARESGVEACFGEVRSLLRGDSGWSLRLAPGANAVDPGDPLGIDGFPTVSRVALCLGLPAGAAMPAAPSHWVGDPWAWWRALSDGPLPLRPDDTVLVVGSGLTAVDMVLGLRERGFRGRIRAVSPGGRWSHAHAPAVPLDVESREQLDAALDAATSARAIVRTLRAFCAIHPWRAVIDALRADTNARWAALALDEQRRVLRHAFGVWNRHRHRMAPDVRATLDPDRMLTLESGRIRVDADGRVLKRDHGRDTPIDAALALDCRGPGFRAALAGDALPARLVRERALEPHPLGTGVCTPRDPSLAVVGAACFGERFETTAVPELRQQAVQVVRRWVAD